MILNKTTEYDIYCFYANRKFQVGTITNSPLRIDKHPSFGLFKPSNTNVLFFKDLSTGEAGNCVKFVQLLFNIKYKKALQKIWNDISKKDLGITNEGERLTDWTPKYKRELSIRRKNYTEIDYNYWNQYGISIDTLKKYDVFPISTFWIDEIQSPLKYTKESPMYAYKIFDSFKIYRPFSETKKDKWRTNCNNDYIQGWQQMSSQFKDWSEDKIQGDLLVITKALKDVMVLSQFNVPAIAPQSELSMIPRKVVYELKKRFKRIVVMFDYDNGGIKGAEALKSKYDLEVQFIPKHYIDLYQSKDISDFMKTFGKEKTKELLNEML